MFPGVYAIADFDKRVYRGTHDPFAALADNPEIQLQYLLELYPFSESKAFKINYTGLFPGVMPIADYRLTYAGGEEKERLSDRGFITTPSDSDPNRVFLGRVNNPLQFDTSILNGDNFSGGSQSFGGVEIINADGALDRFFGYYWSGRRIVVKAGGLDFSYDQFATILEGSVDNIEGDDRRIILTLRDNRVKTDKPIRAGTYAGTGGLAGMTEMAGVQKPLAYGIVKNIAPVLVQYSTLTYQVHDGSISSIDAVRDKGIILTNAGDVADITMATPAAGTYVTQLSGGYIKLGSTPAGQVTADVQGDNTGGFVSAPTDLAQRILTSRMGVYSLASSDIDLGSFATLKAALFVTAGIYINSDMTGADVLNTLFSNAGAYWSFTRQGLLFAGIVSSPSSPTGNVQRIDVSGLGVPQVIEPAWRIKVAYLPSNEVQNETDLASGVTSAVLNFVTQQYRYETYEDTNVRLKNSAAKERVFYTNLGDQASAQVLLAKLTAVYGVKRTVFRVPVYKALFRYFLGDVVNLVYDRYGLSSGKNFMVVGVSDNAASDQTVLTLWG